MILANWQWGITEIGVEAIEGATGPSIDGATPKYSINTERLLETTTRGKDVFYDWPVHMAEKTWVDVEAFNEAFKKALEYHAVTYDKDMLASSFAEARRQAKGRNA